MPGKLLCTLLYRSPISYLTSHIQSYSKTHRTESFPNLARISVGVVRFVSRMASDSLSKLYQAFLVRFSDHHLDTGPFDNWTQIYHLNIGLVRYSDGYCIVKSTRHNHHEVHETGLYQSCLNLFQQLWSTHGYESDSFDDDQVSADADSDVEEIAPKKRKIETHVDQQISSKTIASTSKPSNDSSLRKASVKIVDTSMNDTDDVSSIGGKCTVLIIRMV